MQKDLGWHPEPMPKEKKKRMLPCACNHGTGELGKSGASGLLAGLPILPGELQASDLKKKKKKVMMPEE